MAKAKPLVTPRGVAKYPHLTTPDTKFKDEGEYHVKLIFTGEAADEMRTLLDDLREQAISNAKENKEKGYKKTGPDPYTELEDDEGIEVNFKMKASGEKNGKRWTRRPRIYDASGTPITAALKVGGGSILKVAFQPNLYCTALLGPGVSCWLEAVQVIELVAWGERDASAFGFDAEDGFSAADADEGAFAGQQDDDEPEDDEDEGDDGADF